MTVVGINLLWLVPGVVGGSETSTVTTLHALAADPPPDLRHRIFALGPFIDAHPELADSFDIDVLPLSGRVKGLRVGAEQSWLLAMARRRKVELVHHLGGTMPFTGGPPGLLSIHDLQPFDHPGNFHPVKRAFLARAVPRSVARARLTLTPSQWVRGTVIDRFGVDADRVISVPHGVPPLPSPTPEAEVRQRYSVPGPYLLYPGITYPHKDHLTLVRAFSRLVDRHPALSLVLSGGQGPSEDAVRAEVAALGLGDRVRRIGRVPTPDLVALLDAAALVPFPSRYEGFGLPLIEAMSRGKAVVAAHATAVPEVVGDAGVLVPPADARAWADAIDALLADPDHCADLGERGRQRAADFSPEANLAGTLAAQRQALAGED